MITSRPLLWSAFVLLAVVMAGCTVMRFPRVMTIGDDDWSMEAGLALRTNSVAELVRPPYRLLWEFDTKAGVRSVPLVRDSIVLLGNMRGDLALFDLANGKPLGTRSYGLSVEATPALAGYLIFVPVLSEEGIVAIDVKDGSIRWKGSLGPVASAPLVVEELLYVATLGGKVHCLNRYTGEQLWEFTPQGKRPRSIRSSPALAEGMLVVGCDDGRLFGLDASTGTERWTFQAGGSIFATAVVTGSLVVAPSLDSTVYAVDRSSGSLRWRFDAGSIFYGPASTDGQYIYVGAGNGRLYCLEIASGTPVWTFATASVINSAPLVTQNAVVVGSLDRSLYIIDKANGKELWRHDIPGRVRVSPVLWRGFLVVASENRTLSVFVPEETNSP
jgi:outer membrane protein assembly factor BamB